MPIVIILNVVILNVVMSIVVMSIVVILIVVILNVVAPENGTINDTLGCRNRTHKSHSSTHLAFSATLDRAATIMRTALSQNDFKTYGILLK
jgi:hypothetical protein